MNRFVDPAQIAMLAEGGIPFLLALLGDSRPADGGEFLTDGHGLSLSLAPLLSGYKPGGGGTTIRNLAVSGSYGIQAGYATAPPEKALIRVLIWYGANGYTGGSTSPVDVGGVPQTGEQVDAQVQADVATIVSAGIPARCILVCTDNFSLGNPDSGAEAIQAQVLDGNARIRSHAAAAGYRVVDIASLDVGNTAYFGDYSHLTDAGAAYVAGFMARSINAVAP